MEQESSTSLYLRRALAITLALAALRQLKSCRLSYLFPFSDLLSDEVDKMFAFAVNTSTLFFAWCIAEPSIAQPLSITNLNTLRYTLAGIILTLTVCGDSPLKRVLVGFAIGACWILGWTITSVEQRAAYWLFLRGGLGFTLINLWRKAAL
ncbi:hypothetical protein Asppvi_000120 [Aspergillus pseudoviridinutans]|uniref:Uncharacterized protein n=1 Tax=Aspergillus pseudoviridinutans TaxID=1517512 RepID=A0A9P3B5M3_9EURO|nr:uncharacterized protein Asppvi_000120 [Aspergillus pseudoviridinutans]GIJ81621.1 hypothetical protein Asppvi_000120 [Aspergillus pseudoviridinutans]